MQCEASTPGAYLERRQTWPWWAQCIAVWLAALIVLTVVGLIGARIADLREGVPPDLMVSPYSIPGIWSRWDSGYYTYLAQHGYTQAPHMMGFFPLFPMLVAALSRVSGLNVYLSGMIIAQLSYLAAILLLYKLATLVRQEHGYAMRCVLAMALFPSSFFFFAVYAESVVLAFSILAACLILVAPPRYARAGLAMGLASAARPVGWLLNTLLVIEFIRRRKFDLRSVLSVGIGLVLSVVGIAVFVLYLYSLTGSLLSIPSATALWRRQPQYPWVTVGKSILIALRGNQVSGDWFLYVCNWVDLSFTILVVALMLIALWWSFRGKFNWGLCIYLMCSTFFLLSTQGLEVVPLWGMTRWVASQFPIYLILGNLLRSRAAGWTAALTSSALLIVFTGWWVSGRWVG